MARYIDADKLHYSRVRIVHPDGTIGGYHAVVMSTEIKDAPTADVVEVVRCKDCQNCEVVIDQFENDWYFCTKTVNNAEVTADHYCSHGERK